MLRPTGFLRIFALPSLFLGIFPGCNAADDPGAVPEDRPALVASAETPAPVVPDAPRIPVLSKATERALLHLGATLQSLERETGAAFATATATRPFVRHLAAHPEYGQAYELLAEMLDAAAMRRHDSVFVDLSPDEVADVVAWYRGEYHPDTPGIFHQKRFSAMYAIHVLKPLAQSGEAPAPAGQ